MKRIFDFLLSAVSGDQHGVILQNISRLEARAGLCLSGLISWQLLTVHWPLTKNRNKVEALYNFATL